MVTPEHDALMRQYVENFKGRYMLKGDVRSCDRCRPELVTSYILDIKSWMKGSPVQGAPPYLCIDCARHYGLVW